jgi:phosphohistidine swiveling domain-containing protein
MTRIIELTAHASRLPRVPRTLAEPLVLMLAPLAPHIAEELWQRLGHPSSLAYEPFPQADPALAAPASVTLPVQVNGKVRFTIEVPAQASQQDIAELLARHPGYPRGKVARLVIVPSSDQGRQARSVDAVVVRDEDAHKARRDRGRGLVPLAPARELTSESHPQLPEHDVDDLAGCQAPHAAPAEWEIRALTWGVKSSLALATIDRLRAVGDEEAPAAKNAGRAAAREAAVRTVRALLAGDTQAAAGFEAALAAGSLWMRGRERSRTTAAMMMHELRLPALELGLRGTAKGHLDSPQQIFMLFRDELDDYVADPAAFTERLRERERSYLALFEVVPPFVVNGAPAHSDAWARRDAHVSTRAAVGETITGVSGCTGTARGRARVLTNPDDPSALEPGEILIAPITDPAWTPLFVVASAVVVDVGAPFSHAAIVSRELGIPCVLSATEASKRIPEGALIEVNGDTATVTILEHAGARAGARPGVRIRPRHAR